MKLKQFFKRLFCSHDEIQVTLESKLENSYFICKCRTVCNLCLKSFANDPRVESRMASIRGELIQQHWIIRFLRDRKWTKGLLI